MAIDATTTTATTTAVTTPSSDLELSRLVYGTWRIADVPSSPRELLDRIRRCRDLGVSSIDCADIYGGDPGHVCESLVGEAIALDADPIALRASLQIITKTDIVLPSATPSGIKHYNTSSAYIIRRVEESLAALRTSYIDLLLIHRPSPLLDADDVASAFLSLRASGKVRHFGVSNFTPSQIDLLQSRLPFRLITNQIELHPLNLAPLHDGTLDHAQMHRMPPMIWSPLAQGRLVSVEAAASDPQAARVQLTLKRIASEIAPDVTPDQVAYAWILAHPSKPVVILGTNKLERIEHAVRSTKLSLSYEQWFAIWQASAGQEVP